MLTVVVYGASSEACFFHVCIIVVCLSFDLITIVVHVLNQYLYLNSLIFSISVLIYEK